MCEMQIPTKEELEAAWREIDQAGPKAHVTTELALLALKGNRLSETVRHLADISRAALELPDSRAGITQAVVMSCVISGLNYGLRIGDARIAAATKSTSAPPKALEETELWAWLGEDDREDVAARTGEIGLKQAQTPAGMIPMAAVLRSKMEKHFHQAEAQAARMGKKIRLCRFTFAEVVRETDHGV